MRGFFLRKRIFLFAAGIFFVGCLPFLHADAEDLYGGLSVESLQKQIEALLQQVSALQTQLLEVVDSVPRTDISLNPFTLYLERGISGQEVERLQQFLSGFSDIYPEGLVTGYFGELTERAVRRFQAKYGIEMLGVVGPKTRTKLNFLLLQKGPAESPSIALPPPPASMPIEGQPTHTATTTPLPVEISVPASSFELRPKPSYSTDQLAQDIHARINEERIQRGLFPLTWDWALAQAAYLHSLDQARDNEELTNPASICHYPMIRHEGFSFGFTLKDRLLNKSIIFKSAGENIGILPASKELIYQFTQGNSPPDCPDVPQFEVGGGTEQERTALYKDILSQSLAAVRNQPSVIWVDRNWFTSEEIAKRIVEGWMNSPGHRANILTAQFDTDGIGVVAVNDYFVITHDFVDR